MREISIGKNKEYKKEKREKENEFESHKPYPSPQHTSPEQLLTLLSC